MKDLRPENEKKSEIFSLMITNSAYGTYRKGDETMAPPAIQILRHRVFEKFSAGSEPSEITVYHMVVYYNAKSALRKGVFGGAIGAAIAAGSKVNMLESVVDRKAFEDPAQEEYKRALYTEKENPEKASVYVVYIDAEINGKRIFVKTMAPDQAPEGKNPYAVAVDSAVQYFLTQYSAS